MKAKTKGISPKLIAAVAGAIAAFLLTQTVLQLPPGVVLLCQCVVIALGAAAASPGKVLPTNPFIRDDTPSLSHKPEEVK